MNVLLHKLQIVQSQFIFINNFRFNNESVLKYKVTCRKPGVTWTVTQWLWERLQEQHATVKKMALIFLFEHLAF
jgi:hypothetical protein